MAEIYDFYTHNYSPYTKLPENASLYSSDLGKVVECASCSKPTAYGDCFTSLTIHNELGLGYMVCPNCHANELADKLESMNLSNKSK